MVPSPPSGPRRPSTWGSTVRSPPALPLLSVSTRPYGYVNLTYKARTLQQHPNRGQQFFPLVFQMVTGSFPALRRVSEDRPPLGGHEAGSPPLPQRDRSPGKEHGPSWRRQQPAPSPSSAGRE